MATTSKGASHFDMISAADAAAAVDALDLADVAKTAALALVAQHPELVFTSGRRTVEKQAQAMAGNIVRNHHWIAETYAATPESKSLQTWVDRHPSTDAAEIAAGLLSVMNGWNDAQKRRLSRHFSGQAFDVQPVAGATGKVIKTSIKALPNLRKFLEREGGLIIWHADFEAH